MIDQAIQRAIKALGSSIEEAIVFEKLTTGKDAVSHDVAHLAIQAAKLYFNFG